LYTVSRFSSQSGTQFGVLHAAKGFRRPSSSPFANRFGPTQISASYDRDMNIRDVDTLSRARVQRRRNVAGRCKLVACLLGDVGARIVTSGVAAYHRDRLPARRTGAISPSISSPASQGLVPTATCAGRRISPSAARDRWRSVGNRWATNVN